MVIQFACNSWQVLLAVMMFSATFAYVQVILLSSIITV
jgi:hypothetical protein